MKVQVMLKNSFLIPMFFICSLMVRHQALAQATARVHIPPAGNKNITPDTILWKWDNSLDAVKAAKDNHKIVYEDDNVRILQVICLPGNEEPVHTHKSPSVMWVTQSGNLIYYKYNYNAQHQLVKTDSSIVKPRAADKLNIGRSMEPEGPHSIKNTGTTIYIAYRVEYKKRFEK